VLRTKERCACRRSGAGDPSKRDRAEAAEARPKAVTFLRRPRQYEVVLPFKASRVVYRPSQKVRQSRGELRHRFTFRLDAGAARNDRHHRSVAGRNNWVAVFVPRRPWRFGLWRCRRGQRRWFGRRLFQLRSILGDHQAVGRQRPPTNVRLSSAGGTGFTVATSNSARCATQATAIQIAVAISGRSQFKDLFLRRAAVSRRPSERMTDHSRRL
jgi:hypothetical protein